MGLLPIIFLKLKPKKSKFEKSMMAHQPLNFDFLVSKFRHPKSLNRGVDFFQNKQSKDCLFL